MKTFLLTLVLVFHLCAGTYDYSYDVRDTNKTKVELDFFMYGKFEEIIRFDMLRFEYLNQMEQASKKELRLIVKTINKYLDNGKKIRIKLIGHTNEPTDDKNENIVDSDTYANHFLNLFRNKLDTKDSEARAYDYVKYVKNRLVNSGIDSNLIMESRRGDDMAFTDETYESANLSNRVMVTIYVDASSSINQDDNDSDGVKNRLDKCLDTKENIKVDKYGCPLDTDKDGVYDYKDKCSSSPKGIKVDEYGCAPDTDGDGVYDYEDRCFYTPKNVDVDLKGCEL